MEEFLIDTHTFIWYATGDQRLSKKTKQFDHYFIERIW